MCFLLFCGEGGGGGGRFDISDADISVMKMC